MPHATATVLTASPSWMLRALALHPHEEITHMRVWDPREDSTGGPKRPRNRREGCVGPVAIPADQRGRRTSRRGGSPPNWEIWRSRRGLPLTYRMTQVLTGHGVFGEYLMKIGRETTDICHRCGEGRDTAQHTLEFCPAWELSRYTLRHIIDERLTPSTIVKAMLSGLQKYEAVRLFYDRVMFAKERAESERKRIFHSYMITRWREVAVRRPRAVSSPTQRTAIRRGNGARGNSPPPASYSTFREFLKRARTRGLGR